MSDSEDDFSGPASPASATATPGPALKDEGDICGDGSILKEIITKGTGWQKPPKGAEVSVHYVGTLLDGSKFDSSRDRGDHFKFKLGLGQVIKGWDEGVSTMLKGEKAKFTIQGHKAYGARGSPPKIPANATLVFEVELFSWTNEEDVSEARDHSVRKETLKAGEGYKTPGELSQVDVKYKISLAGESEIKVVRVSGGNNEAAEAGVEAHTLDDGTLPSGLEQALKRMKKGEQAKITMAWRHAGGIAGDGVGQDVIAEVELVDFRAFKDTWDMGAEEKISTADKLRDAGNELFKKGDLDRAERRYRKSLTYVESEASMDDEHKAVAKGKKVLALINLAAVQLKQHKYKDVRENCGKALELDSTNVKGLFRRGSALLELGEWDDARRDLKRALELEPSNTAAQQALATLAQRVAKQQESDKKRYRGMFERLSKLETKAATAAAATTTTATATAAATAGASAAAAPAPAPAAASEPAAASASASAEPAAPAAAMETA